MSTARHIDSTPALRALVASVPDVPVDWLRADDATDGGHYCPECLADYDDCPRTPGDHDTCPMLCADCRERMGFVCASCAWPLPDAEHAEVLCATCHNEAMRDARDEYEYRRDA